MKNNDKPDFWTRMPKFNKLHGWKYLFIAAAFLSLLSLGTFIRDDVHNARLFLVLAIIICFFAYCGYKNRN
jgi:hypothetical protein